MKCGSECDVMCVCVCGGFLLPQFKNKIPLTNVTNNNNNYERYKHDQLKKTPDEDEAKKIVLK